MRLNSRKNSSKMWEKDSEPFFSCPHQANIFLYFSPKNLIYGSKIYCEIKLQQHIKSLDPMFIEEPCSKSSTMGLYVDDPNCWKLIHFYVILLNYVKNYTVGETFIEVKLKYIYHKSEWNIWVMIQIINMWGHDRVLPFWDRNSLGDGLIWPENAWNSNSNRHDGLSSQFS